MFVKLEIKATNKFDVDKGFRFSTYANCWIRQSIVRAIAEQSRAIRVSGNGQENMKKLKTFERKFHMEKGRLPLYEEIQQALGYTLDEIKIYKRVEQDLISLQKPITEDRPETLIEFIVDDNENIEEKVLDRLEYERIVKVIMTQLSEKESIVMTLRYGLIDGKEKTLDEIGEVFGLTKERIRQIEVKSLKKVKDYMKIDSQLKKVRKAEENLFFKIAGKN